MHFPASFGKSHFATLIPDKPYCADVIGDRPENPRSEGSPCNIGTFN